MEAAILQVSGGLGLFLLGMVVMTDALRSLAGDSFSRSIARFTHSPMSGAATGTVATAVLQSSSATTLAAVGFVGAGLLTFPQALGVIFGANIGTTLTGWLVVLLGFKVSIGTLVLPLVPLGMLLHLFGRRWIRPAGLALAGFAVIFVGIGLLQQGMSAAEGIVTPATFPGEDLAGRAMLVGIGVAVTIVTQSSSAGVATAITAVNADAITLAQAAALVIGMDIGTTFTALLATVGGSTASRRTGIAHVIYNGMTGVLAFALLQPYLRSAELLVPGFTESDPEIALVAFHSGFNLLGVILVLPVTSAFAKLVVRIVPDRRTPFARRLDPALLIDPSIAVGAATTTLADLARTTFDEVVRILRGEVSARHDESLDLVELALSETRHYFERMALSADMGETYRRRTSALLAVDHLDRLVERARRFDAAAIAASPELDAIASTLARELEVVDPRVSESSAGGPGSALRALRTRLEEREPVFRAESIEGISGEGYTRTALARLDGFRWLRRVCDHAWRIVDHLERCRSGTAPMGREAPVAGNASAERPDREGR